MKDWLYKGGNGLLKLKLLVHRWMSLLLFICRIAMKWDFSGCIQCSFICNHLLLLANIYPEAPLQIKENKNGEVYIYYYLTNFITINIIV